jgi:DNA primase
MKNGLGFDRAALPLPQTFFERELGRLGRPNRQGWAAATCPWHKSSHKVGRSLAVNLQNGGWICWGGCGKGDLIGFVRKRDGCDFKTACKTLGAWRGHVSVSEQKRIECEQRERKKREREAAKKKIEERSQRLGKRDQLLTLESFRRQKSTELGKLEATGEDSPQREQLWAVLQLLSQQIAELDAEYRQLSGLDPAEGRLA